MISFCKYSTLDRQALCNLHPWTLRCDISRNKSLRSHSVEACDNRFDIHVSPRAYLHMHFTSQSVQMIINTSCLLKYPFIIQIFFSTTTFLGAISVAERFFLFITFTDPLDSAYRVAYSVISTCITNITYIIIAWHECHVLCLQIIMEEKRILCVAVLYQTITNALVNVLRCTVPLLKWIGNSLRLF